MGKDWVNGYIRYRNRNLLLEPSSWRRLPKVVCADGFTVSMQVGDGLYSTPRVTNAKHYDAVELGYPSAGDPVIKDYAEDPDRDETDTVYPYVPIAVVNELFEKHGGISNY